ncbi:MAG: AMP-binding protein [Bacteroidaceae bacterium]|nr:AMP-binding protein [Bacteroidaceae bacterium]
MVHFLNYIDEAIKKNWDKPAVTNYGANTYTYGTLAESIERMHLLFEKCGIKKGDKVALCAKNSAEWCISFLAIVSYDAVAVPLLSDFLPGNVADLTRLSGSRMLLVDSYICDALLRDGVMPQFASFDGFLGLVDVVSLDAVGGSSKELVKRCGDARSAFAKKFPQGVSAKDVDYCKDEVESLALISYTSGTSSAPKGVMLRAKSISGNIEIARRLIRQKENGTVLSMLPLAHIMGLSFDFIFTLAGGCHLNILTTKPTPARLLSALADVKPFMFITVPLLVEKIFRSKVIPVLKKPAMRFMMAIPGLRSLLMRQIRTKVMSVFGENIGHAGIFVGGAAIGKDVDDVMQLLKIPYAVGYGMTECGPLISYKGWSHPMLGNDGDIAAPTIEVRIDSEHPARIPGEVQVRGDVVTEGYYNNPEATKAAFTRDGWLKTGDMAIRDRKGHIYIKGRCKNMILTGGGQNIYPEEIEELVNSLPMVVESLVVSRKFAIVALVVIDKAAVGDDRQMRAEIERQVFALNAKLPAYSQISICELREEPFEKTPKQSIKRFMYN